MNDETPTPLEGELDFLRGALSDHAQIEPNLWAIRQKIAAKRGRKLVARAVIGTAAAVALAFAGFAMIRTAPRPETMASTPMDDVQHLRAAVAQLAVETELLRAEISAARVESNRALTARHAETTIVLLESARYWERTGGDPELARARYAEILTYFPHSDAAAAAKLEMPADLKGRQRL